MIAKAWYVVFCKAQKESDAQEHLERQGYEVFLPYMQVKKRQRGAYKNVTEPMFPRYLFIRLDRENDNWSPIRSTRGVISMVRFGTEYARVSDALIASLFARVTAEESPKGPLFVEGESVRVIDGPFEGYEAIFTAQKGQERAIILLSLIQKEMNVQINVDQLEKIS